MTTLQQFLAGVERRKTACRLSDAASRTEALRNKGGGRTPAKRELLRRAEQRARAAGRDPITTYR